MKKLHKGTIKNARLVEVALGSFWVEGNVYGHNGFEDGDYIHTSSVEKIDGNTVETRNSIYTVEWVAEPDVDPVDEIDYEALREAVEEFIELYDSCELKVADIGHFVDAFESILK